MKRPTSRMRLYSKDGNRLYLNQHERECFLQVAQQQEPHIKLLCLVLFYSGCRLSEALNLRMQDIQLHEGLLSIQSLKKRNDDHVREVPVPKSLLQDIQSHCHHCSAHETLWHRHRSTAWRQIKQVMKQANITGLQASPKGLRHSFGVTCMLFNISLSLVQKWMGHADLKTTAIYSQAVGEEERQMAQRLWQRDTESSTS